MFVVKPNLRFEMVHNLNKSFWNLQYKIMLRQAIIKSFYFSTFFTIFYHIDIINISSDKNEMWEDREGREKIWATITVNL